MCFSESGTITKQNLRRFHAPVSLISGRLIAKHVCLFTFTSDIVGDAIGCFNVLIITVVVIFLNSALSAPVGRSSEVRGQRSKVRVRRNHPKTPFLLTLDQILSQPKLNQFSSDVQIDMI